MRRIVTVTLNPALDFATEIDVIRPDTKLRCAAPRQDPGGGGVNVSRAIARLGGVSTPMVALGGANGTVYRDLLSAEGLSVTDLGVDYTTRHSLTVNEVSTATQYRFMLPGPTWTAEDCAQAERRIAQTVTKGDLLVPSGSLPPGVPAEFFPRLNARLAPQGVDMILDTSGAALSAAAEAVQPLAALRMDRAEAAMLAGPLADLAAVADVARDLVARGAARLAAVASGAEGTVIASAEGVWHCCPPAVDVVSKVGAGDSFVGAFALALASGEGAAEACAQGTAAAADAVGRPGTELCARAGTDRIRNAVTVRDLAGP